MAISSQEHAASVIDIDSDYGSDLDDATLTGLIAKAESQPLPAIVLESIEAPAILDDHGDSHSRARVGRIRENVSGAATEPASPSGKLAVQRAAREASIEIEYDEINRTSFTPSRTTEQVPVDRERSTSVEPGQPDTRTPIQRFRTAPKKPLSVTDLVSPAWCELQYWYNLTKYGKVKRTQAMKEGSSVHKVLEEQVHTEVTVETVSKEDRFALRIWNIVQGLRTLRRTGMTRELEVWGVLHGEVVNGIIDQITTECPDEEAEARLLEGTEKGQNGTGKGTKQKPLPSDQRTLTDYLILSQSATILEQQNGNSWLGTLNEKPKTLYLVDVKTRQSKSLPSAGSQLRPTAMQLMTYHRLFSNLAANEVPADRIFARYNVDPTKAFSDSFLAQMCNLDLTSVEDDVQEPYAGDEIFAHNTLLPLWSLMISEFATTVHQAQTDPPAISPLLTAEFRTPGQGKLLGRRSFAFDAAQWDAYMTDEMDWWRGDREAKGVDVEEAYKCRICQFAEECTWRATKIEEGIQKAKLRNEKRRQSAV